MSAAPMYVVMWRHRPGTRLQVQPFVYPADHAAHVAGQLVKQFRGEAFTVAVALPDDEDPKD